MAIEYIQLGDTGNNLVSKWANSMDAIKSGSGGIGYIIQPTDDISQTSWWTTAILTNQTFSIISDFDFGGATVGLPAGVVLIFNGGVWSNGTINGDNSMFTSYGLQQCFETDLTLGGAWSVDYITPQCYGAKTNNDPLTYLNDVSTPLQKCIDSIFNVVVPAGFYYLAIGVTVTKPKNIYCFGSNSNQTISTTTPVPYSLTQTHIYTDQDIDLITIASSNFYWYKGIINTKNVAAHTKNIFKYDCSVNIFYGAIDCDIIGNRAALISGANTSTGVNFDDSAPHIARETHFIKIKGTFYYLKIGVWIQDNDPNFTYVSAIDCDVTATQCKQMYRYEQGNHSRLGGEFQVGTILSESEKDTPVIYNAARVDSVSFDVMMYDLNPSSSYPAIHWIYIENYGSACRLTDPYLLNIYSSDRSAFRDYRRFVNTPDMTHPASFKYFNNKASYNYNCFVSRFDNLLAYYDQRNAVTFKKYAGAEKDFDADLDATVGGETPNITISNPTNVFKAIGLPASFTWTNAPTLDTDYVEIVIPYSGSIGYLYVLMNGGLSGVGINRGYREYFKRVQLILKENGTGDNFDFNFIPFSVIGNGILIPFERLNLIVSQIIIRFIGSTIIDEAIEVSEIAARGYQQIYNPSIDIGGGQTIYGNLTLSGGIPKLLSQPVYADNAAAVAGGLGAGDTYCTSTGQLMVVYEP